MKLHLKITYAVLALLIALTVEAKIKFGANLGHRMSGGPREHFSKLPENSLAALKAVLLGDNGKKPLQFHENFRYLEFDIQETADGEIIVFHNQKLSPWLPNNQQNLAALNEIYRDPGVQLRVGHRRVRYSDLKIQHLTLEQVQSLILKNGTEPAPSFHQVLEKLVEWNLRKPLAIDIKYFRSDSAREKVIELASYYGELLDTRGTPIFEDGYDLSQATVNFISFAKYFKNSFPFKTWCQRFQAAGFLKIYRAIYHWDNLCSKY
ncbi:MAG: hypothetical protein HN509_05900 [Halobacteriovoraceae bacterium]|jgi:glycerophosphoryl diester phosphodiesterase|nr:hypothetical protein [Halobacteriovoraceae bacterium]MBT5094693.1 hypothetical protein [Halobacteriovoraceae bacterium]